MAEDLQIHRRRLHCNVAGVDDIFPGCLEEAQRLLTPAGVEAYLDAASTICQLGRGQELPLIFLQRMPLVARIAGEVMIPEVVEVTRYLSRSGNAGAIAPYLDKLPAVTRRLETDELLRVYFDIVRQLAEQAPQGLPAFLDKIDVLLDRICIGSVLKWVDYGLRSYRGRLHEIANYFALHSADARAALQRERSGTLLVDHERKLHLFLRAFWSLDEILQPYSLAFDHERRPQPHLDKLGFHLPDVYEDLAPGTPDMEAGYVAGLDRYRAALAHLAAHRLWTRPFIADNFNRYQHLLIETFEDSRVEWLAMQRYPGLRRLWLKLHPLPKAGDCPPGQSCIRHLAAMLSRALLDPHHPYTDPALLAIVQDRKSVV
jgi:nitric oxide reductase NorD protein